LDKPSRFVGINLDRDRKKKLVYLSRTDYIQAALDLFGLTSCKPIDKLYRYVPVENSNAIEQNYVEQLLGMLQYLACSTRPDIIVNLHRQSFVARSV